jgi:hypothetical protein
MDKETIALIIAQNGLGTASAILLAKAMKLEKKLSTMPAGEAKTKATEDAKRARKTAEVLTMANEDVAKYLAVILG